MKSRKPKRRIAGPVLRIGRVLQARHHRVRRDLRLRFEDQRDTTCHVRGRHRRTGQRGRAAQLERIGGEDPSARGADVGLEAELRRQAERTEARDQTAGAEGYAYVVRCPGQRSPTGRDQAVECSAWVSVMATTGIVIGSVPAERERPWVSAPATLLYRTTAAAPATWALIAFA